MSILLPDSVTYDQIVDFVITAELAKTPAEETANSLVADFGLSPEDAELAWDRVLGGVVRAATKNPANCPDLTNDPLAHKSFQLASNDWSIVQRIRPEYAG